MHYNAPHWPWLTRKDEAESRRIEKLYHFDGGSLATYLTMIRQMDEGIGRILRALAKARAERDTLVVFTSDNGGERFSDTWPLVGKKMDLLEGGIRVPYIVRWPTKVRPGRVTAQPAITMDWVATFLEAAGVEPHPDYPLDGVSLLPVLRNPSKTFARELYWKMLYRNQQALREGDWKYLSVEGDEFLFDLAGDERERANHAQPRPGASRRHARALPRLGRRAAEAPGRDLLGAGHEGRPRHTRQLARCGATVCRCSTRFGVSAGICLKPARVSRLSEAAHQASGRSPLAVPTAVFSPCWFWHHTSTTTRVPRPSGRVSFTTPCTVSRSPA